MLQEWVFWMIKVVVWVTKGSLNRYIECLCCFVSGFRLCRGLRIGLWLLFLVFRIGQWFLERLWMAVCLFLSLLSLLLKCGMMLLLSCRMVLLGRLVLLGCEIMLVWLGCGLLKSSKRRKRRRKRREMAVSSHIVAQWEQTNQPKRKPNGAFFLGGKNAAFLPFNFSPHFFLLINFLGWVLGRCSPLFFSLSNHQFGSAYQASCSSLPFFSLLSMFLRWIALNLNSNLNDLGTLKKNFFFEKWWKKNESSITIFPFIFSSITSLRFDNILLENPWCLCLFQFEGW